MSMGIFNSCSVKLLASAWVGLSALIGFCSLSGEVLVYAGSNLRDLTPNIICINRSDTVTWRNVGSSSNGDEPWRIADYDRKWVGDRTFPGAAWIIHQKTRLQVYFRKVTP